MVVLFDIAKKEVLLVKSKKIALAVIILYPFILMASLQFAFGSAAMYSQGASIAVFSQETDFFSVQTIQNQFSTNIGKILVKESKEDVINAVRKKEADLGLVVHNEKGANGQFIVDVYLDNTNVIASKVYLTLAAAGIRQAASAQVGETMKGIWERFSQIDSELDSQSDSIDGFLGELEKSESELNQLEMQLNAINVSELNSLSNSFSAYEAKITSVEQTLSQIDSTIPQYQTRISTTQQLLSGYQTKVTSVQNQLAALRQTVSGNSQAEQSVDSVLVQVNQLQVDLGSGQSSLAQAQNDLVQIKSQTAQLKIELADAKTVLRTESQNTQGLAANLTATINNVKSLIQKARQSKQTVTQQLQKSKQQLADFRQTFSGFSQINPEFLANPVVVQEQAVYPSGILEITIPMALALMLFLLCLLLPGVSTISEYNQGAYVRLRASPVNTGVLLAGKMLGHLLVALFMGALVLLIAYVNIPFGSGFLGLGLSFHANLIELFAAIVLVAFGFSCIGLFLTNFTRSESTLVLVALVIITPMIFLSGIIFPTELMSPAVQFLSQNLPFTVGLSVFSGILLKGISLWALAGILAVLVIPAIALLAYTAYKY